MAKKVSNSRKNSLTHSKKAGAKSPALWSRGVNTSFEFLNAVTASIADVANGAIPPNSGNTMFAGSRSILKMLELQVKYGSPSPEGGSKLLKIGT